MNSFERWAIARRCLLGAVISLSMVGCAGDGAPVPPADPGPSVESEATAFGVEVTYGNLFEYERLWPHQIRLTEPWKPRGWAGDFGWGQGVLLRVREDGFLRVDFSRFGKHWVPAEVTDVLERANRLRTGQDQKFAPNLVLELDRRLLDPSDTTLKRSLVSFDEVTWVIAVFVDPSNPLFEEIAAAMSGFERTDETVLVLVPQGGHRDAPTFEAAYHAGWPGDFLQDRFVPSFIEGHLDDPTAPAVVQVMTSEGRVLFESSWGPDVVHRIDRALEGG